MLDMNYSLCKATLNLKSYFKNKLLKHTIEMPNYFPLSLAVIEIRDKIRTVIKNSSEPAGGSQYGPLRILCSHLQPNFLAQKFL